MKIGVSYFGNRILKHVRKDMLELKENGFTFVLHTFSEFDLLFRKETMKNIIKTTHDVGLEVVVNPWGVGNVFGGEPFSNFAVQNYSDSCQVLDNGETTGIACPNAPKFNEFMYKWIDAVAESGVDYILWDEPHFHEQGFLSSVKGRWGCRCSYCKEKFFAMFQEEMPEVENEKVKLFKEKSLMQFVEQLASKAKQRNIKNILYLTADIRASEIKEKWEKYFRSNSLHIIASGPYWQWEKKDISEVGLYSQALYHLSQIWEKDVQIWVQGFAIQEGREEELSKAISLILKEGVTNFAVWGYEGVAHESWISSDNPDKVWNIILTEIKKHKE